MLPTGPLGLAKLAAEAAHHADGHRHRLEQMVSRACRRRGLASRSSDALLTRDVGSARKPPLADSLGAATAQAKLFA